MGRSRAVAHSAADDPSHSRSKRKRTTSNMENLESAISGQILSDGKALYHCNYCNKDISGKIRIKCVMCPDFDLCVECFSVGAEITPHKSNHPYRVMDNLSFPLICPDWNADEEILLLEGIEMYGMGNWAEVAEHVGTKTKSECIDHYKAVYMNSPCFPLPDMSHVVGKNREELLAMAKEQSDKKEVAEKEEAPVSAKVKVEEVRKDSPVGKSSSGLVTGTKDVSNTREMKNGADGIKIEDRSVGGKKLRSTGDDVLTALSGYNEKRQEFEVEYDNDAEQLISDMEFRDTDTEAERELKLRVLRIYNKRLDERRRRKDFILDRNLLYPDPFEKNLSPEEKEICQRYRVFMRFNSKEEHEELLRTVIEEHRIAKRIKLLQEARTAGCRTSTEAERYISEKRRIEAEETARKAKESVVAAGSGGKGLVKAGHPKTELDASPRVNAGQANGSAEPIFPTSALEDWDITGFPGADLLSENEKRLCVELRILPSHYLNIMQVISTEVMKGTITKKSDAHNLFKVDPQKIDRIYDMLVKKGMAP